METLINTRQQSISADADTMDRIEVEQRQALLAAEVQHRVQNTLAIVQSLAHMSFSGLSREIVSPFEQRLIALAGVHNLLVQTAWEGADLRNILERALEALPVRGRVHMCGPAVGVTPTAAVLYGLAFHELCAAAIKRGPLSSGEGRLDVSWTLVEPDQSKFHFVWREHNGPAAAGAFAEGSQSRLLKRALAAHLGKSAIIRQTEDGLTCEFYGPVQRARVPTINVRPAFCG